MARRETPKPRISVVCRRSVSRISSRPMLTLQQDAVACGIVARSTRLVKEAGGRPAMCQSKGSVAGTGHSEHSEESHTRRASRPKRARCFAALSMTNHVKTTHCVFLPATLGFPNNLERDHIRRPGVADLHDVPAHYGTHVGRALLPDALLAGRWSQEPVAAAVPEQQIRFVFSNPLAFSARPEPFATPQICARHYADNANPHLRHSAGIPAAFRPVPPSIERYVRCIINCST
jgi:hypothetical protein